MKDFVIHFRDDSSANVLLHNISPHSDLFFFFFEAYDLISIWSAQQGVQMKAKSGVLKHVCSLTNSLM